MTSRVHSRHLFLIMLLVGFGLGSAGPRAVTQTPKTPASSRGADAPCTAVFGTTGAQSEWVHVDSTGNLAYKTLDKGDQIMDFSAAGYMGGGVAIPAVSVQRTLGPSGGDDIAAIQSALDAVSNMPLVNGVRGAVLLRPGVFNASDTLHIRASGVVLRGSGSGAQGTVVNMTGQPHTFMNIGGSGAWQTAGTAASITTLYIPAGATRFRVDNASGFNAGDAVLITRPTTSAWVHFMGMDRLTRNGQPQTWVRGDIQTDRVIAKVKGKKITLDVPLSDSFDAALLNPPGPTITKYTFAGRISQAGIEALRVVSPSAVVTIDQPSNHLLTMDTVINAWAKDVVAVDTVNSIVIGRAAKQVTLDGVNITHSVATTGSASPADFAVIGTQVLINRCSVVGDHVFYFVTQDRVSGPNVVLNFTGTGNGSLAPHQRWATGLLLDNCNVPGGGINLMNRGTAGSGHGWAIGWGVAWNSTGKTLLIQQPPGSENFCIGCKGAPQRAAMPGGDKTLLPPGILDSQGTPVVPASLYLAQLCQRLGPQALTNIGYTASGPRIASPAAQQPRK